MSLLASLAAPCAHAEAPMNVPGEVPGEAPAGVSVVGDGIPAPVGGRLGDPARGAALFAARQISTCLLCHADPSAPPPLYPPIGPSLAGIGSRLGAGQIRLRIVDAARVNPETIMPSFYVTTGLTRVGRPWQGRPVLDAGQIEDLVAWLASLRAP